MDRVTVLLGGLLALTGVAFASQIEVSVGPEVEISHYGVEYPNVTDSLLRVNVTPENFGSANCMHSLKAEIGKKPGQYTRYSEPRSLTSGKAETVSITLLRLNKTGAVPVSLYSTYCDKTVHLANFTYNQTQRLFTGRQVEAATTHSNRTHLSFEISQLEDATLIPLDYPPVWKIGRTKLADGQAKARIQPSVYQQKKHIMYAAVQDGEVTAKIRVDLKEDNRMLDRVLAAVTRTEVAAASVALNLALILVLVSAYRQSLKQALAKLR
jgi:hypothetical protein